MLCRVFSFRGVDITREVVARLYSVTVEHDVSPKRFCHALRQSLYRVMRFILVDGRQHPFRHMRLAMPIDMNDRDEIDEPDKYSIDQQFMLLDDVLELE